ncbi:MAG: potassium channel protein, partial [Candidatus Aminicenantes bacterium]|nr:potassium channel protein [Candidatus Aminicenantes bacterium]
MNDRSKIIGVLIFLFTIVLIDVSGFILIEKVSVLDAFYMTFITISTVGFTEVFPLS